jgi:hypothetical protein
MRLSMTIAMPRRVSEPWLSAIYQITGYKRMGEGGDVLKTQDRILPIAGKTPLAARKTPKYRTPTDSAAATITYPTAPTVDKSAITRPLCWSLSATQVEKMVTKNARKNGGASRPCALTAVNPMSLRMVGRKTGREE